MAISRRIALLPAAFLVTAASKPPLFTWGKPDVPFAQYRSDAVECALRGYTADIRELPATRKFVHAFNAIDRDLNNGASETRWQDNVRMFQPDAHVDLVGAYHQSVVDQCLYDRGYVKFTLTKSQIKQLKRLKTGSNERKVYMHSLARVECDRVESGGIPTGVIW